LPAGLPTYFVVCQYGLSTANPHTGKASSPVASPALRKVLDWVHTSFGRGPFHTAWAIDEQHAPRAAGCCSPAGVGSDTARWTPPKALLAPVPATSIHAPAVGALNYATHFARGDGLVSCCGGPGFKHPYWFRDGYRDYLGPSNTAMAALPERAPRTVAPPRIDLCRSVGLVHELRR
jgi:hypothetical protein